MGREFTAMLMMKSTKEGTTKASVMATAFSIIRMEIDTKGSGDMEQ